MGGPSQIPLPDAWVARNVNFNVNNAYLNLAGPGTIEPPTRISLTKVGQQFINERIDPTRFLDELTQLREFTWGSFDGTTNAPIVYPNGVSIEDLENQLIVPISPAFLPLGNVDVTYTNQFSATGGSPPYTWSLAPNSAGLPPGLTLDSTGSLSGTPTEAGTFDFIIRMVDSGGITINKSYFIQILP